MTKAEKKHAHDDRVAVAAHEETARQVAQHKADHNGLPDELVDCTMTLLMLLKSRDGLHFLEDCVALVDTLEHYGMASVPEGNRLLGFMAEDIIPLRDILDKVLSLLHPTPLPLPLVRKG